MNLGRVHEQPKPLPTKPSNNLEKFKKMKGKTLDKLKRMFRRKSL